MSPRDTVYVTSTNGFTATRIETGIYRIDFPSDWKYNIFGLQIIVYGIGYTMNGTHKGGSFCKATLLEKDVKYFKIGTSDDSSANDGDFGFLILDTNGCNSYIV